MGVALGLGIHYLAWATCGFGGCPDVRRLRAFQPGQAPILLDRHGRQFADLAPMRRVTVPLARIPKLVGDAFIAVEDKRFREHHGVDWRRVGGALLANLRAGGVSQGFSTISMQLARNAFPDAIPASRRTLRRKLVEVRVARIIEARFTKREILELYLNHIYFGNGLYGIEAAAQHYFGRPAARLTLEQGALLAAMPKAPTHYDPRRHGERARERRNLVLHLMAEQGSIDAATARRAAAAGLGVAPQPRRVVYDIGPAPYFADQVRRYLEEAMGEALYARPLRVHTTLDLDVHRVAAGELQRQLERIESGQLGRFDGPRYHPGDPAVDGTTPYLQGAVVVLDAASGDALAWSGGRSWRHSAFDRAGRARRQIGSAFKPFVYATALVRGWRLSDGLDDTPLALRLPTGETWSPRNITGRYEGRITVRQALVRSQNVATVRLAQSVGLGRIVSTAGRCGLPKPRDTHPSLALGTLAATPLELAAAYTPFATLGERATPRLVLRVEDRDGTVVWEPDAPEPREVLDPAVAFLVTDTLREAIDRGSGTGVREAGFTGPAAGKTGTTNDGTDAWFVGYTPTQVGAVWIGFDKPRPIAAGATGGRLAAPVWGRLMKQTRQSAPAVDWSAPGGVVEARVDLGTGRLLAPGCGTERGGTARQELYLEDTEPDGSCPRVESLEGVLPWLWYQATD